MELPKEVETARETITGVYMKAVLRDYQTGYTVFRINTGTEIVTCVGSIIEPAEGMKVEVTGVWAESKYGLQLTECIVEELFTDKSAMMEYLCNVPGIGRKTAEEIVEILGEKVYEIATGPDAVKKLKVVPGVTDKRAEAIVSYIRKTKEQRKLFELVARHGGTYSASNRIYKEYGEAAVGRLTENPYTVGAKAGFSFRVCDSIAKEHGIDTYSHKRVMAAVTYVLKKEAVAGHTYLESADLMKQTRRALGVTEYDEALATACIHASLMIKDDTVYRDGDKVYLSYLYFEEVRTAYAVKRLLKTAAPLTYDVEELIAYAEEKCGVKYADQQREAFSLLLKGGLGIITGGPGTGKSTVIKGLLEAYKMMFPKAVIKLCAPTGRASQRMKETTGMEATTIHRILEYKPYGDLVSCKNDTDPIDADLLFVDESSMISIDMADILFSAIKSGCTVILTGDINQLPAVGAGNVLHDLIESGVVPTVHLVKTYRQAEKSLIIENARRIRDGITKLKDGPDFQIIETDDSDIPETVKAEFQKYNDLKDTFALQVLTPARRKRETASNQLSRTLQELIRHEESFLKYGDTLYRVGDKVMFMRNNYAAGYFNGDMGLVKQIDGDSLVVRIDDAMVTVTNDLLDDLSLAYATTVHKSQGSEFATVIVVLPSDPAPMLQRNMIYTAITRAKKRVIIVAAENCIRKAIMTKSAMKRNSGLTEKLQT